MKKKDFIEHYDIVSTGKRVTDDGTSGLTKVCTSDTPFKDGDNYHRRDYEVGCRRNCPQGYQTRQGSSKRCSSGTKSRCNQHVFYEGNKYGCCTGQIPFTTRFGSSTEDDETVCAPCWAPGSTQCDDDIQKYCAEPNPTYAGKGDYTRILTDDACINVCRYDNRLATDPRPTWCDDLIMESASQIHTDNCLFNSDKTQREKCSTLGQLTGENANIPEKHQLWFGKLWSNNKGSTYNTTINKICQKETSLGIKLEECDCVNRRSNPIYDIASTSISNSQMDSCWWKPCKDMNSFLVTTDLQEPNCAGTICASEINVSDTGGNVDISDIKSNISCSGTTVDGDGNKTDDNTDDKTDDVIDENGDGIDGKGKREREEEKKRLEKEQRKKEKIKKILLAIGIFLIFAVMFGILVKFLYFNKKV